MRIFSRFGTSFEKTNIANAFVRIDHGTALDGQCGSDTTADDTVIFLRFDEGASVNTGETPDLTASSSDIIAVSGSGKLYYNTGNVVAGDVTELDKAGPFIWKAVSADAGTNNNSGAPDAGDTLIVSFSESTNGAVLSGIDLDALFTLSNLHTFHNGHIFVVGVRCYVYGICVPIYYFTTVLFYPLRNL